MKATEPGLLFRDMKAAEQGLLFCERDSTELGQYFSGEQDIESTHSRTSLM